MDKLYGKKVNINITVNNSVNITELIIKITIEDWATGILAFKLLRIPIIDIIRLAKDNIMHTMKPAPAIFFGASMKAVK
jgi:hypothetical protein